MKEIWEALVNAHEETSQVRKFRIAMLFTKYETFRIKENESLSDMMTRLTTLINELSSLGKILTTEEQVDKVLRELPKGKWDVKVTAIREAKNLTTITLNELVGNLRTYEMNMLEKKKDEDALDSSLTWKKSVDDNELDVDDEQQALLAKSFKSFFKKRKVRIRKIQVVGSGPMIKINQDANSVEKLITISKSVLNGKLSERRKELNMKLKKGLLNKRRRKNMIW